MDIPVGAWVHTQNVQSKLGDLLHYTYEPEKADRSPWKCEKKYEFFGYKRTDGSAGIRNEVWIIPTVGCVNNIARAIETASQSYKTENIDGIYAYSHPHGCSQLGDDQVHTQKILSGLIHNPNAGAVLVLSLGCENNQISLMKDVIGDYDPDRVKFLVCQDVEDEIEAGTAIVKELCAYASQFHRQPCDATQIDLVDRRMSGLTEAEKILKDVRGVGMVYFSDEDVVRHDMVGRIIRAYETYYKQDH